MYLDDFYPKSGPGKDRLGGKSAPEADTTTRAKSDPLAPVQYHEPKQILKYGGATPSYGMETRSPIRFNPDGSKVQQPDIFRRITEAIDPVRLVKPVNTAAGFDPISQMSGGEVNAGTLLDAPRTMYQTRLGTRDLPPGSDPDTAYKKVAETAGETPQWIRQLTEFMMGAHGANGGMPRRPTPMEFAKANTREGAPIAPVIETLKRQDAQVPPKQSVVPGEAGRPQTPQPIRQTTAAKSRPSYMASPEEVQAGNDKNFAPGSYGYSPRRTPEQLKADKEAAIRAKFGNVPKTQEQPVQQQQHRAIDAKRAEQLAQKEEANRRNPSTKQEEPPPLTLAQKLKKKIKDVQSALLPSDKEMEQRWAENVTLHEQRLDPEKKFNQEQQQQQQKHNPPPRAGKYINKDAWEFRDKQDLGKPPEVETRGRGAPMKERLVRRADKVPLREGLKKDLKDAATSTDYNTVRGAIDGAKNNKLLSVPDSKYLNKLGNYLFRKTEKGETANLELDAYLKASGNEFGKPVRIADIYPLYLEKARSLKPEDIAKKRGNPVNNTEFYIKDFDTFKKHFFTFGKRAGERYNAYKVPDSPAVWIVDGDHVILSPHIPGQEAARAYSLPLETGLKVAETMPEPPKTVPEVQTGRVPGGTSYKGSYSTVGQGPTEGYGQQQQGKPPAKRSGSDPTPPPLDGDIIPPKKKPKDQRTPAERRLEGEVPMKSEFAKDTLREGSSGLPRDENLPFKNKSDREHWAGVEKLFSPSTVSNTSRAAAQIIRAIGGTGKRQIAVALGKLEEFEHMVGALNREAQLDVVHWLQTGGKEGHLSAVMDKMGKDDQLKFRNFATTFAHTFDVMKQEILALDDHEVRHFIENYLPQLWKDPPRARDTAYTFLNERKIPTYKDGMFDKNGKPTGREPITTNPIEMTMRYMAAMRRFLDIRSVVKEGVETKYVRKFKRSQTQYPDVVPLNFVGKNGAKYVANKDFARVFNNWVSRGFKEGPEMTSVVEGLQRMTNMTVALKFGLSGFHATTMVVESWFAGLADGIQDLSKAAARGDSKYVSRAVKKFANAPLAPYNFYKAGKELESIYLQEDRFAITPEQQYIGELAAGSNLTIKGIDPVYRLTEKNDYLKPVVRLLSNLNDKAVRQEVIQSEINQLKSDFTPDSGKNRLQRIANPVVQTVDIAARLLQTVGAPLFQKYIPRLKAGIWYTRMSEYIADNPGLSRAEHQKHANKLADVVDDQLGELNQDNVFINQHMKQTANLLMASPGWKLGSLRLLSQGGAELVGKVGKTIKSGKAQELDERAAYMIAALAGTVGLGLMIQYAMTGKGPESAEDLILPQTGGKTPSGDKERAVMPGYIKEPIGMYEYGPLFQLLHAANPAVTSTYEMATNEDYKKDPVRDMSTHGLGGLATRLAQVGEYMASGLSPITMQQTLATPYPKSNINMAERALGFRAAGAQLTNPKKYQQQQDYYGGKAWRRKETHDAQDKIKRGIPLDSFFPSSKSKGKGKAQGGIPLSDF